MKRVFLEMGIPLSESVLDEIMERCDPNDSGLVDWEGFQSALPCSFLPLVKNKNAAEGSPKSSFTSLSISDGVSNSLSGSFTSMSDNCNRVKSGASSPLTRSFNKGKDGNSKGTGFVKKFSAIFGGDQQKKTKIESANLFSSVECVESLNMCHSDGCAAIANSSYRDSSFAVTLRERDVPLIFVCSKPQHRESWVEAFRICVLHACESSTREDTVNMRKKFGWQHLVIRSSMCSLVILDDAVGLGRVLQNRKGGAQMRKHELDLLDDYNGYSALHFATKLNHIGCMKLLLQAGAKVKVSDAAGFSPMYHALSGRSDEAADLLEEFGADRNDDLKAVIHNEIRKKEAEVLNEELERERASQKQTEDENRTSETESKVDDDVLQNAAARFGGW